MDKSDLKLKLKLNELSGRDDLRREVVRKLSERRVNVNKRQCETNELTNMNVNMNVSVMTMEMVSRARMSYLCKRMLSCELTLRRLRVHSSVMELPKWTMSYEAVTSARITRTAAKDSFQ